MEEFENKESRRDEGETKEQVQHSCSGYPVIQQRGKEIWRVFFFGLVNLNKFIGWLSDLFVVLILLLYEWVSHNR